MTLKEFIDAVRPVKRKDSLEMVVKAPNWETAIAVESVEITEDTVVLNVRDPEVEDGQVP